MPAWPITVPQNLYDAISNKLGEPFADSYLWGAKLRNGRLLPRTQTAWSVLSSNFTAKGVLADMKIALEKPAPFGSPGDL